MSTMVGLTAELAQARQELEQAQSRVAELEAQVSGVPFGQPPRTKAGSHNLHILDKLLEGCQIIGFDWRYLYLNDTAVHHSQQARADLLGYTMMERYPGIEKTEMFGVLQRCMQERTFERMEDAFVYPDGTNTWFELIVQPVEEGIFIFSEDITERRKSEELLRQALAAEKELGELKSRFVSRASHEFRTPLATILALTETLSAYRHKLPEDQIEQRLDKIKEQVGHLKEIMDDLLLLARMQARRVEFNPVMADLDALCRSVLDEFQNRADIAHQIQYRSTITLTQVVLDKKLMRQILNNLVSNAIKYSPEAKPIEVDLEEADGFLILSVRDQGIGVPEADLKHIFEPFHRAANVGAIAGTGLGLVITRESVELHGGTISVESQVGIGTTFRVRIPIPAQQGD